MNFSELKQAAREKLNSEGFDAKILVSLPDPPGSPDPDKSLDYGISYGGMLYPLSLEPYIAQANKEKSRREFVDWLASHGGRINFDFFNTHERYTLRWIKKHQKMAKDAGIFLSNDNELLILGVSLSPEKEMILTQENFPDIYEKIEFVLKEYIEGHFSLVLD